MENRITKKQHYVPQFYLRQWCDESEAFYPIKIDGKGPPDLKVFEKKSGPSRFCYENFFYAQHTGEEDEISQTLEKSFADIEGVFSEVLPKLESKILSNELVTDENKYHLSEFMIFMWLKGKQWREQSQKMSEDVTKQINKFLVHNIDRSPRIKADMEKRGLTKKDMVEFVERGEYSVDFGNMYHLALMKDMYGFCNLLSAKDWYVYISRKGEFIATDAPYADKPLNPNHFWGNDFFAREQSFVLSPKVVIVAVDPKDEAGGRVFRKELTDDRSIVQLINCVNLMQSVKFGFHKNRDLLEELKVYAAAFYKSELQKKSDPNQEQRLL